MSANRWDHENDAGPDSQIDTVFTASTFPGEQIWYGGCMVPSGESREKFLPEYLQIRVQNGKAAAAKRKDPKYGKRTRNPEG